MSDNLAAEPCCPACAALRVRVDQLEMVVQKMQTWHSRPENGLLQVICSLPHRTQKGRYNLTALVCARMQYMDMSTQKVCELLYSWYRRVRLPDSHTKMLSKVGGNVWLVYTNQCIQESPELGPIRQFMRSGELSGAGPNAATTPVYEELRAFDAEQDVWQLFTQLLPGLAPFRELWAPAAESGCALDVSPAVLAEWQLLWPDADSYQSWRVIRGSLGLKALSTESSIILHLAHLAGIHLDCWQYQQRQIARTDLKNRVYLYGRTCIWPIRLALCLCSGFRSQTRNHVVTRPGQLLAALRGATAVVDATEAV